MSGLRIEKLRRDHAVDAFDCGSEELNRFLIRFAFPNQQAGASQTYLGLSEETVVGFYTLVVGQVRYEDAPERLTKGLARHPVPIMLLARLAVSVEWQGRGLGAGLMKDAMLRTLQAVGIELGIKPQDIGHPTDPEWGPSALLAYGDERFLKHEQAVIDLLLQRLP